LLAPRAKPKIAWPATSGKFQNGCGVRFLLESDARNGTNFPLISLFSDAPLPNGRAPVQAFSEGALSGAGASRFRRSDR
jgi:hypothetical protein